MNYCGKPLVKYYLRIIKIKNLSKLFIEIIHNTFLKSSRKKRKSLEMAFLIVIVTFLILEVLIFLLLSAPLPHIIKKNLLNFIHTAPIVKQIMHYHNILLFLILITFVDSFRKLKSAEEEHEEIDSHAHQAEAAYDIKLHQRITFAQRNLYMTGFTLFASLALNRLVYFLNRAMSTQDEIDEIKKKLGDGAAKKNDELKKDN